MFIAVRTGLEPATPCVTGMYSNQLNYRTIDSRYFPLASAKLRCIVYFAKFFVLFLFCFFEKCLWVEEAQQLAETDKCH